MEKSKLLLQLLFLLPMAATAVAAADIPLSKPTCQPSCGNIAIPFPFGIGSSKCFLDDWYEVVCENNTTLRLKKMDHLEVLDISLAQAVADGDSWIFPGLVEVNFPITYLSENCSTRGGSINSTTKFTASPFVFSSSLNYFTAVGCNVTAFLDDNNSNILKSKSLCTETSLNNLPSPSFNAGNCSDNNGCSLGPSIPGYLQDFSITFQDLNKTVDSSCSNASAFLVSIPWFDENVLDLNSRWSVPVLLEWRVSNGSNLSGVLPTDPNYKQADHSYMCNNDLIDDYWQCSCAQNHTGNPYLLNCEDIDECADPALNDCHHGCVNTLGYYSCVDRRRTLKLVLAGISGAVGALLLVVFLTWMHRAIKRRKIMQVKKKCFKQNGGLLLQQQLASPQGNVEKSNLFTLEELERATDNFNESRVLGRGGQGVVYKGMLTDGRTVAIKKAKALEFDEGNVEQFINEVFILSQISHRNVVKLLGCCLETKFPLLIYEFISNGTLYHYLHESVQELPFSWDIRLRIADEVAGALSYLHFAASVPIYHRDIKTRNILLDEKYQAKVADFGISRLVSLDETHVTTRVQGTIGYLDPEFFQSSKLTDKSDVYSFGVVLVELLTKQKPNCRIEARENMGLASYFVMKMEDNCLFDILDPEVLNHGDGEEITAVADLAKRCLNLNGRNRPTMKEVAMELHEIRRSRHSSLTQQNYEESSEHEELEGIEPADIYFQSRRSKSEGEATSTVDSSCELLTIATF